MAEEPPLLSVVVPTRARPRQLADALAAMTRLRYPPERYELIVVDDGSPEPLDAIVATFRSSLPLTLMKREHGGPGSARNAGADRARGRYVVFTADDCQPDADWLGALERRLRAAPDAMIGGSVVNGAPDDLCATTTHLLIDYLYRCDERRAWNAPFFTPNNLALPIEPFRRIGGFDASMGVTGEDRELCGRWLASGLAMVRAPEAIVRHVHPQSIRGFWQQHVSYGRGSRRFYRRRVPGRGERRSLLWMPESGAFYWDLLRYPLLRSPGYRGWLHVGLMVLAQIANGVGFTLESLRPDARAGIVKDPRR